MFYFSISFNVVQIPTILRKYKYFQRFILKYLSELIIYFNHATLKRCYQNYISLMYVLIREALSDIKQFRSFLKP